MNPNGPGTLDARIRPFSPGDEAGLYTVCLETGDRGSDGTRLFSDGRWLGHRYVGPYLALEPGCSWVLEDASGLCGYVFGAPDSERFARRFADEWMPVIARQLEQMRSDHAEPRSQAEAELREWFKRPTWFFPEPGDLFPSHLHIDLLPRAQGRGYGGRMVNLLLDALGARGSAGVHLGMHPLNQRALRFYGRLGFQELALANETLYLGRRLSHGT